MPSHRHFAGISREQGIDSQRMQHFMSHSPWSGAAVCAQVRDEVRAAPELTAGAVLLVDESADDKAGDHSAGAARQYNGRLGKVEMSQVGVMLGLVNLKVPQGLWSWVDAELYLPQTWFDAEHQELRRRLGIPEERRFHTKVDLAWTLIERAIEEGLPFECAAFDAVYGRSAQLRAKIHAAGKLYMAEVPADTLVYEHVPRLGVPEATSPMGRPPCAVQVIGGQAVRVDSLLRKAAWHVMTVRATERGELSEPFAFRRVWTVHEGQAQEQTLVMRREAPGKYTYALCNAAVDTPKQTLAWWKCQRYFIERANQDAKSELGWDELQARRYLAWEHHLALTVLASWFVAQTKYELAQEYPRDEALYEEFQTELLPALSMANVRALLRAVMPLRQLTAQQATEQVIEHLLNRTRSRNSRLKKQRRAK